MIVELARREIQEDEEWDLDKACARLELQTRTGGRKNTYHVGDFPDPLLRTLSYFSGYTLVPKLSSHNEVRLIDIYFIDKIRSHTFFCCFIVDLSHERVWVCFRH